MQSLDLKTKEHTMNFIFDFTHLVFSRYQKKNPQDEKNIFRGIENSKTIYVHTYFKGSNCHTVFN